MQITQAIAILIVFAFPINAFANAACEKHAVKRGDFLVCTNTDTKKTLSDAEKLYHGIRKNITGDKLAALDKNFQLWKDRLESECVLLAFAFNDWSDDYAPDTDFQVAQCRQDIATDQLGFYKLLACPEDMEISTEPKCPAIKKMLNAPITK